MLLLLLRSFLTVMAKFCSKSSEGGRCVRWILSTTNTNPSSIIFIIIVPNTCRGYMRISQIKWISFQASSCFCWLASWAQSSSLFLEQFLYKDQLNRESKRLEDMFRNQFFFLPMSCCCCCWNNHWTYNGATR